jgi:hypothetical protein
MRPLRAKNRCDREPAGRISTAAVEVADHSGRKRQHARNQRHSAQHRPLTSTAAFLALFIGLRWSNEKVFSYWQAPCERESGNSMSDCAHVPARTSVWPTIASPCTSGAIPSRGAEQRACGARCRGRRRTRRPAKRRALGWGLPYRSALSRCMAIGPGWVHSQARVRRFYAAHSGAGASQAINCSTPQARLPGRRPCSSG